MSTFGLFAALSAAGWILLIVGAALRRHHLRRLEQERTRATGTVVAHDDGGRGALCRPVIEFTADGRTVRQPCSGTFERKKYPVGQTLDVLYDADDPGRFHPDEAAEASPGRGLILGGLLWIMLAAILAVALIGPLKAFIPRDRNTFPLSGMPKVSTAKGDPNGSAGGFRYTLDGAGNAILTGYTGGETDVSLPILVEGHIVNGLAQSAFSGSRRMTRVQVPGTIRALSNGAFAGCLALREVVLSDGVQAIGIMAFAMCPSLTDMTIPASVATIGKDAFPEDCAATFHVAADSAAERYCREKGFKVEAEV